MKLNKILPLFILASILLTAVASATVYEPNYIYNKDTNEKLTDVSVIGFVCNNEACTSNTKLWTEILNTGNGNKIVLQYPTKLKSSYGYLVYFYKSGYVPYKIKTDWYGEGTTKNYNVNLEKIQDSASAQIDNFQISKTQVNVNEQVKITADILSPRLNTKNVQFIPSELKNDYYGDDVKITLKINGEVVETENLDMLWSTEQNVEFSFRPTAEGTYTIKITTEITDNKFTNTKIEEETATIKVSKETPIPQDTTAPIITISYPENKKTYNSYITELKYTAADENLKSCFYSTDNKDKAAVSCNVAIKGLESKQGKNTWTIYAVDSYGNSAEKSVTFTIDLKNDGDDKEKSSTPTGYRDLTDNTLEDEQYHNQFKANVYVSDETETPKTGNNNIIWIIISAVILIAVVLVIIAILRR